MPISVPGYPTELVPDADLTVIYLLKHKGNSYQALTD
jgi:hypothetical protein